MPDLRSLLLHDGTSLRDIVLSVLVAVIAVVVRAAAMRVVRTTRWASEDDRLRWTALARRLTVTLLLLGLLLVWAEVLRALAVSVVAIAAALVLATKELILCLTGGILRASARTFTVGDRIEIAGLRGDVIDHGLLATTIREIGPGHQWTGRAVVIPNSALLSASVINESFTDDYVLHLFSLPLSLDDDWRAAEDVVLQAAREATAEFQEEADRHMREVAETHGLPAPTVEPRVSLHVADAGKVHLIVRVPVAARHKGRVEQHVVRKFVEHATSWSASAKE